ncbi:MAG: nuclear transport factor 2 family protein [Caulobacteraceae bacterium]
MKELKRALGIIGLACAMICCASSAFAQAPPEITTQTLIDRAKIEDMLTRYMTELGHSTIENYVAFYTDDAEMIMGGKSVKGRAAIFDEYKGIRAAGGSLRAQAYAFNTLLSNPLITVHGDRATVQLTFTEVITDTEKSAPRPLVQGREYDELARVNGQWLFKKRQVVSGRTVPVDWRP